MHSKDSNESNSSEKIANPPPEKEKQSADMQNQLRALLAETGIAGIEIQQRQMEAYSSPLPHPAHLAEYRKDCPDILERSLVMAENAQAANIELGRLSLENGRANIEKTAEKNRLDSRDTGRAQYLGFIALIVLGLCAFGLALWGHEKTAMAIFGAMGAGYIGNIFAGKFSAKGKSDKDE